MKRTTRGAKAAHFALTLTVLLLPTLSLVPLGGLYLWEKGYLLPWAIAAALTVGAVYAYQNWLLGEAVAIATREADETEDRDTTLLWSPAERAAWTDVRAIARTTDIDALTSFDAVMDLGQKTINAVANRIHPEKSDAVWRFTLPEALAISERVSGRLSSFIRENIPFGDRLTVSQLLQVYRWRYISEYAERAYDIWRIVRLTNPATAVTNEARERLSRAMMQWGKEQIWRRLSETFVEEVGRAAIDLYGGRLRVSAAEPLDVADTSALEEEAPLHAPVNIVVTGDDAANGRALLDIMEGMVRSRSNAVADYLQNSSVLHLLTKPALRLLPRDTIASQDPPGLIAYAISTAEPRAGKALKALTEKLAKSSGPYPLLLPVQLASAPPPSADDFKKYPGVVLAPVEINLETIPKNKAEGVLWDAIERSQSMARRIQMQRLFDNVHAGRRWFGGARQAAYAIGNIAKSLFTSRKSP